MSTDPQEIIAIAQVNGSTRGRAKNKKSIFLKLFQYFSRNQAETVVFRMPDMQFIQLLAQLLFYGESAAENRANGISMVTLVRNRSINQRICL